MPNAPLRDSRSLFDPYSFLPAGRPEDANSPFPSHTFFPKDQEVLTHSCSGISYTEIGQTCQAIWMSSRPLLPFITLRSSELDSQLSHVMVKRWNTLKEPFLYSVFIASIVCLKSSLANTSMFRTNTSSELIASARFSFQSTSHWNGSKPPKSFSKTLRVLPPEKTQDCLFWHPL